jgi:hypothetical protein
VETQAAGLCAAIGGGGVSRSAEQGARFRSARATNEAVEARARAGDDVRGLTVGLWG